MWFLFGLICTYQECHWVKVRPHPEYKAEAICDWAADRLAKNTIMYFQVECRKN